MVHDGAARFASGLSVAHFRRRFTEVHIGDDAGELARAAAPIARLHELHGQLNEQRTEAMLRLGAPDRD